MFNLRIYAWELKHVSNYASKAAVKTEYQRFEVRRSKGLAISFTHRQLVSRSLATKKAYSATSENIYTQVQTPLRFRLTFYINSEANSIINKNLQLCGVHTYSSVVKLDSAN
jgi:hypothetical protein